MPYSYRQSERTLSILATFRILTSSSPILEQYTITIKFQAGRDSRSMYRDLWRQLAFTFEFTCVMFCARLIDISMSLAQNSLIYRLGARFYGGLTRLRKTKIGRLNV
jgi:hypothetical protein